MGSNQRIIMERDEWNRKWTREHIIYRIKKMYIWYVFFVVGLDTDKYMGISYICQFRCYPDLGIGKVACRQISYAYLTCLQILKSTWNVELNYESQPRYGFINHSILVDKSSRVIMVGGLFTYYQQT